MKSNGDYLVLAKFHAFSSRTTNTGNYNHKRPRIYTPSNHGVVLEFADQIRNRAKPFTGEFENLCGGLLP